MARRAAPIRTFPPSTPACQPSTCSRRAAASAPCAAPPEPVTDSQVGQASPDMNILLLGSGGREHALAWKIAASPLTDRLYCAPGNAGMAQEAECVALDLTDHPAVIAFCRANKVDFVVVGPEGPLVAGIVDDLEAAGIT